MNINKLPFNSKRTIYDNKLSQLTLGKSNPYLTRLVFKSNPSYPSARQDRLCQPTLQPPRFRLP
jgi:hypothetical protein